MKHSRRAIQTNHMGTTPIPRLILTTALPLMLSLLINSLYNFVDSVFVSKVSEEALTALSLAAPVQTLVSALGLGNAIGLNAAISKALGQQRPDKVKKIANAAMFIALCAWMLISVICLLAIRWYFDWQSNGNAVIAAHGMRYLSVCMLFSLGQMGQWVFDRFVIASGKSHLFLFTLSAASVTNLILDPILIFGMPILGIPAMGTLGAAIATVIGQHVGLLTGVVINRNWNKEISFSFTLTPDWPSVRDILRVGVPSTFVQTLTGFVTIAMNSILFTFSASAVAVYGVLQRMHGLCIAGVNGVTNGLIPIVAYNYGARNRRRIREALKWAIITSAALYAVFLVILELAPSLVLRLFNASEHLLEAGIPAARLIGLAWLISIPNLVVASALQGLSKGSTSMMLTMIRQAVLPIILAYLLCAFNSLPVVWSTFAITEAASIPIAVYLWRNAFRKIDI